MKKIFEVFSKGLFEENTLCPAMTSTKNITKGKSPTGHQTAITVQKLGISLQIAHVDIDCRKPSSIKGGGQAENKGGGKAQGKKPKSKSKPSAADGGGGVLYLIAAAVLVGMGAAAYGYWKLSGNLPR